MLRKEFSQYLPYVLRANRLNYFFSSTDSVLSTIFQSIMFIYGGIQIINSKMSIGDFIMINSYFSLMLKSVKYFVTIYKSFQDASASYSRILEFLQTPEMPTGSMMVTQINAIDIDNLSYEFASPNGKVNLFNKLSEKLIAGNVYAIVGSNGTGKSTLLKIIAGLYESDDSVRINNYPLFRIDMNSVRQTLYSIVPQKLLVPSGTVQEYLAEMLSIPSQDVPLMLEKSYLLGTYARSLTLLLKNECITLSGGELRKLHLWLALNKHSNVLILDEPSIELDQKSKNELVESLNEDPFQRIIIIMTHDINIINNADFVIEID